MFVSLFDLIAVILLCSLEHLVTSLKQTNQNYHSPNNQSFLQPQQHQLQIQLNGGDQPKQTRITEQPLSTPLVSQREVGKLLSPKTAKTSKQLQSTGPVTDL